MEESEAATEMNNSNKQGDTMGELNDKTVMPLGMVIACVAAFIGGALWINNSLNRIENRLASMEYRVSDRWTGSDMKLWVARFKLENPNIKVPSTTFE